jgi:3-oxoacid CoA-transferase subunit A
MRPLDGESRDPKKAGLTIAEADELVELGAIDPDDVHLPGVFVQHVVEVRDHENPFEYRMVRQREGA